MSISNSRKIVRRKATISFTVFILMVLLTIICFAGAINAKAASKNYSDKYYKSIEIMPGDTLWSIAGEYITDEYRDRTEYIEEICALNNIRQNEIQSGQDETIPYYASGQEVLANNE